MLRARILTSIFLIPSFLAALIFLPELYWSSLMLVIITIGAWEWGALAGFSAIGRQLYAGFVVFAGASLLALTWYVDFMVLGYAMFAGILLSVVFWVMLVPLWLASRYQLSAGYLKGVAGLLLLLPTWFALICLREPSLLSLVGFEKCGPFLLLAIMATVWIADSAAYFAGKCFGKHKLAPQISPGKTWEGVIGAVLAVSLYGLALVYQFKLDLWLIVVLWTLTILSIMGDLLESLIKRQANMKDSGNLLPGHGGILDRIDGLTSSLPLAAFYVYFPVYFAAIYAIK